MEELLQLDEVFESDREEASAPPRNRIAVIAVHGIGKHAAGETQNSMVDLLLALPTEDHATTRAYRPFRSVGLQIPLQPVRTGKPVPPKRIQQELTWRDRTIDVFRERSVEFAEHLKRKAGAAPAVGEVSTGYTDLLLDRYEGGADGNAYITSRLEGRREQGGPDVHVYEVLWSDLTKPDNSIVSFFLALFQLLLHLASLSRTAADTGAAEATGRLWSGYRNMQRYAVRMLQLAIPLLEVMLFIALTACFSSIYKGTAGNPLLAPALAGVGATVIAFLAVAAWWSKWEVRTGPWLWAIFALVPGIVFAGLGVLFVYKTSANAAAAFLWWLMPGSGLLYWILDNYKDVRAGARTAGWTIYGTTLFLFACLLWKVALNPQHDPVLATFWVSRVLLAAVRVCWGALIGLAFAAFILGELACLLAWRKLPKPERTEKKARGRAAVRTGRLALALPSVLFMLVTLLMWDGFTYLAEKQVKDPLFGPEIRNSAKNPMPKALDLALRFWPEVDTKSAKPANAQPGETKSCECKLGPAPCGDGKTCCQAQCVGDKDQYVANMLAQSVGYQLPVTLGLLAVAGFLMGWWALPGVLTEGLPFPTRGERKPPRQVDDKVSVHMGSWLSRGLDATAWVTILLWCSIFLAPALYASLDFLASVQGGPLRGFLDILRDSTTSIVVGYGVAGTAILAALAKGGQTVLSTVLDVDNYLRTGPEDATPRAKIFERYISTLRYVNDPAQGYDGVVIVAHSLGALISGDLLLYVHAKNQDKLQLPTSLLTIGNPLRQLLNRFFPYLYDWIRATPDNGLSPLGPPLEQQDKPSAISADSLPHPNHLRLDHWASAYRSGDYVGRSLWLDEWFWRTRSAAPNLVGLEVIRSNDGSRSEVCIGAGAHVHYMDDTAPEIAWLLDSLICTGRV